MNLRLALRNLLKNAMYTTINLVGMSIGMACCFLIISYLQYEQNFDTFFPKKDRLYRIGYHAEFTGEPLDLNRCPAPIGPAMYDFFPQVEKVARMFPRSLSVHEPQSDQQFEVESTLFADSTVQEVMGFDFIHGDPNTALRDPFTAVLTDETARRIFGAENVLGRQLKAGTTPCLPLPVSSADCPGSRICSSICCCRFGIFRTWSLPRRVRWCRMCLSITGWPPTLTPMCC